MKLWLCLVHIRHFSFALYLLYRCPHDWAASKRNSTHVDSNQSIPGRRSKTPGKTRHHGKLYTNIAFYVYCHWLYNWCIHLYIFWSARPDLVSVLRETTSQENQFLRTVIQDQNGHVEQVLGYDQNGHVEQVLNRIGPERTRRTGTVIQDQNEHVEQVLWFRTRTDT